MTLSAYYIVRVTTTVFQVLGLFLTAWRLYIRLRIHRFWWEDVWAAVLMFTGLLWVIVQWVLLLVSGNRLVSIVTSWIYTICFTSIVTLARLSVLFSIIRIIHGSPRLLKFTYACVAFYVACWAVLIVEKVVQCASNPSWHSDHGAFGGLFCQPEEQTTIFEFTTDCAAVSIIVALPLRMLWRVKLPRGQRRMILCIFASSVFLAIGALFHVIGQVLNMVVMKVAGVGVEVTLALLVSNLLVAVTYAYRTLSHGRDDTSTTTDISTSDDDDFTTPWTPPAQPTTLNLTSIDLDVLVNSSQLTEMTASV